MTDRSTAWTRRPLCFMQVNRVQVDRNIPEEEWMWHLVQHMCGIRHRALCAPPRPEGMTPHVDPVGHSVRQIALSDDYEPLNDMESKLYETLLTNALHGEVELVSAWFNDVKKLRDPHLDPVQPVATIGAFKGHLPILKFALEMGARMDRDLARAIQNGSKESAEMAAFYDNDKGNVDEVIDASYRPDPKYKPNVLDEVAEAIDRVIQR